MRVLYQQAHGKPCPYCGRIMRIDAHSKWLRPTRDHLVPRPMRRRGEHSIIIVVCYRCNNDRGGLLLDEWERRLRYDADPRAEHVRTFMSGRLKDLQRRAAEKKFSGMNFVA